MSQTPDVSELLQGSLDMKDFRDKWVYYDEYDCYGLEYIVYCDNPADPVKECMNIYVPAAYMNADGTINEKGTVNGYTAATALSFTRMASAAMRGGCFQNFRPQQ